LIALVLLQGIVHAQTPNPGQPIGGGGTPANNNLTVQASPSADLPLGEKVTLTLQGYDGGTISWWRSCPANGFDPAVNAGECDCSSTELGYPGDPTIFDSLTTAGTWKFEAIVSKTGGTQKASVNVKSNPPNGSDTTIGPLSPFKFPTAGNKQVQYQTMKTTLKWNGTPLGKCAAVCCREKVKIIPNPAYVDKLKFLRFEHLDWIPTPCLTHEYYGDPNDSPGVWTLKWDSPSLLDKNWFYWTLDQWEYIQTLPVGTVLATRQHRYQFEGSICSGFSWGPLNAEIWFEYVIRRVKNADGTLQEPPKNVAEWRIISNPGPM